MRGKFIVIEGQGFTGKTTQANSLVKNLQDKGIESISLRHPGGAEAAEKFRQQLLEKKAAGILTPDEELELLFKALRSLVDELIIPSLEKGVWVVLTRFIYSAIVYQGYQEGLDKNFVADRGRKAAQNLTPDLSILIDLPEDEILQRQSKAHDNEIHAYNNSDREILKIRREAFLEIFESMDNSVIIDGNKTKEEISDEILREVIRRFNLTT
jgi:dTMP kinase